MELLQEVCHDIINSVFKNIDSYIIYVIASYKITIIKKKKMMGDIDFIVHQLCSCG